MAKTTWQQDREFDDFLVQRSILQVQRGDDRVSYLISRDGLLEEVIEWIAARFDPGDVFSEFELTQWARDHGFIEDRDV